MKVLAIGTKIILDHTLTVFSKLHIFLHVLFDCSIEFSVAIRTEIDEPFIPSGICYVDFCSIYLSDLYDFLATWLNQLLLVCRMVIKLKVWIFSASLKMTEFDVLHLYGKGTY